MIYIVQQVYPLPVDSSASADIEALYGSPRPSPPGFRPWVGLSMITSLDGSVVVDGRSGGLGSTGDREVFGALRRRADVILVGATTAAAENYRRPQREGLRIGVVTRHGVDTESDLFQSGAGFVITPQDGAPVSATIDVIRVGFLDVDLLGALRRLGDIMPTPSLVLAEGGPRLNATLFDAGCVDELNVTTAPIVVGGNGPRLTVGAASTRTQYQLAHSLVDDEGYQYNRWVRR